MSDYEVEKILGKKKVKRTTMYLVKWVGYPEEEATWEPAKNLSGCEEAIEQYENSLKNETEATEKKEEAPAEEEVEKKEEEKEEEKKEEEPEKAEEPAKEEEKEEEEPEKEKKEAKSKPKKEKKEKKESKRESLKKAEIVGNTKNDKGQIHYSVKLSTGKVVEVTETKARQSYTSQLIDYLQGLMFQK